MGGIAVFLYHALYETMQEWEQIAPEDRPYAIPRNVFEAGIDRILQAGTPILSPNLILNSEPAEFPDRGVMITFDDGHASLYHHAFPVLHERGLEAIFFITTDFVQSRTGFCTWSQLLELARGGMSIQSHGKTHRFLPDLDDEMTRHELADSKALIEEKVGKPVFSISFPGGRYKQKDVLLGRELGYRYFFTSEIGLNRISDFYERSRIKRIPIKAGMEVERVRLLAQGEQREIVKMQMSYSVKAAVRKILGNRLYHLLYKRLASS